MTTLIKQKRHCRSLEYRVLGHTILGEIHGGIVVVKTEDNRVERAMIRQYGFKKAKIEITGNEPKIESKLMPEKEDKKTLDLENQSSETPVIKKSKRRKKLKIKD